MIQIICDDCEHEFFVDPSKAGGKVACPKCGDVNRIPALPVAREAGPVDDDEAAEDDVERLVVTLRPAMFRAHPLRFSTIVILVAGGIALGLAASTMSTVPNWTLWPGLIIAAAAGAWWAAWWIRDYLTARMVITNKRTIHRTGLLAKHSSEVLHTHIRNIRIEQTVVQRLFNVGDISMDSSAGGGANVEINMRGVRDPEGVRDMIDEYRSL